MYKVYLSKRFVKEAKKLTPQDLEHVMKVLTRLSLGETLEPRYRDHALSGFLEGVRDCHIKPDLVLIYQVRDDILELVALRIAKHSKVFK